MKKKDGSELTREEFRQLIKELGWNGTYDYLEANLSTDRSEPMSLEEIEKVVCDASYDILRPGDDVAVSIAKAVQPLTVKQGFVPDWSKAPEWANGVRIEWSTCPPTADGRMWITDLPRPKVKRMRTREEKEIAVGNKLNIYGICTMLSDSSLDDLCRAANISLEVEE